MRKMFHRKISVLGVMLACLLSPVSSGWSLPVQAAAPSQASIQQTMTDSWTQYKQTFIQDDGRVIDWNGNITTSEGQSYAMLRAFWMRDKDTFDKAWLWAKNNLQVPRGDHLFSWKWGERPDHTWGALDKTSATDADQDIALALILAYQEWKDPAYITDAKLILNNIWERLTMNAPLGRVVLPGDWPQTSKNDERAYQINPSYFAPYAYRVFAEIDKDHDWSELVDSSYEILGRAMGQAETHLPPDWVAISLDNDTVNLYTDPLDPRSDFGYEAIRVYWRVAMDALLDPNEKRATAILHTHNVLPRFWTIRTDLPVSLTWDGITRHPQLQSGAIYGGMLPGLYQQDVDAGDALVVKKILPNLKPGAEWNTKNDYYSQNWLWFGLGLYDLYQRDLPVYNRRGSLVWRLSQMMQL